MDTSAVCDSLRARDAVSVLHSESLRMADELALLHANAVSAQETLDGLLAASGEAGATPALQESIASLSSELRTAESRKTVAIDAGLVRIDEALELAEELLGLPAAPLVKPHDGVSGCVTDDGRISRLLEVLDALQHGEALDPAADSTLFVHVDEGAASSGAPATLVTRLVSAGDVQLSGLSAASRVILGRSLRFSILYAPPAVQGESEAALPAHRAAGLGPAATANAKLVARTRVVVSGAAADVIVTPLPVEGKGVAVVVSISGSASDGDVVEISRVSVGGAPVDTTASGFSLPLRIPVVSMCGLASPGEILGAFNGMNVTPCTTPLGELYIPVGSELRVEGSCSRAIDVWSTFDVCSFAVAVDVETNTILIGNHYSSRWVDCIVAVDATSLAPRWIGPQGVAGLCRGITVLADAGVCVVTLEDTGRLVVARLSDGALLASVAAADPVFVTADPASATVYVSTSSYEVEAYRWDGAALRLLGLVPALSTSSRNRPIAVVPPGPGSSHSHLVVGKCHESTLDVFRLPGLERVCETRLPGEPERAPLKLYGLTADATGTTLVAVVAQRSAALLLPWPLPGMPPLD